MSNSQPPPAGAGPAGLSRGLVLLLATACGVIVANNYYAQPLLPALQHAFGTGPATAGLCVTLNQLGYAAGLLFIVPLGDLAGRRRLVTLLLSVDAVVLAGAALAPGIWPLIGLLAAAGTAGTAINVLVPTAATLAGDHQRGRVVGTVMTGLLLGILLARTVAGLIDSAVGWRPVYGIAAVAAAVLAVTLHAKLPDLPAAPGAGYLRLLGSVAALVRDEPFLRRRMAAGALGFGAFQLLWTALPFMLSDRPYSYGSSVIGLFGLLGAAGAAAAQPAGRLQDRGVAHGATGALLALLAGSWALLAAGRHPLPLVLGIVLLDIGVQGVHVLNQGRIYLFPPQLRARTTTAYMSAYFLGGSAGGAVAVTLYPLWGWGGVCAAGAVMALAGLALWTTDRRAGSAPAGPAPLTAPAADALAAEAGRGTP
ncbi:MFS transporter [Kitasatospora sp. NPDC004272]